MLIFYEKYNEIFEFGTRMYTMSTENGIEIVSINQTVSILVLCVKTLCGIDLLSFNKNCGAFKSHYKFGQWACSRANRNALGHLTDVTFRFRVRIRVVM